MSSGIPAPEDETLFEIQCVASVPGLLDSRVVKRTFNVIHEDAPLHFPVNEEDEEAKVVRHIHYIKDNNSLVGELRAPGDDDIEVDGDALNLSVPDDLINTPMRTPGQNTPSQTPGSLMREFSMSKILNAQSSANNINDDVEEDFI